MIKTCVGIVLLVILANLFGCQKSPEEDSPAEPVLVSTATLNYEMIQRPVQCLGVVYPRQQQSLFSGYNGKIVSLPARQGESVEAGDTLAILFITDIEVQRRKRMTTTLLAPFAGRVISLYYAIGDSVPAGKVMLLLAELEPRAIARVSLTEEDYRRLEPGCLAEVTASAHPKLALCGSVSSLGLAGELSSLPYQAEIIFENPGMVAPLGSAVKVRIISPQRENVLLIPQAALLARRDSEASVFITDAQNKFALSRSVKLGPEVGSRILIEAGLDGSERLIVQGQERLKNGSRIRLK